MIKNNKITKKPSFKIYFLSCYGILEMQKDFRTVVTTAHKNSSAFRQDTKQFRSSRLKIESTVEKKKITLKYHLIISVESKAILSSLPLSITGNIAPLWKQWKWKSDNPSTELLNYEHEEKRENNVDRHIPSWAFERQKGRKRTVSVEPLLRKLRKVLQETSAAKECATSKQGRDVNRASAALDAADQYCFLVEKTRKKSKANYLAQEKLSNWKLSFHI